jgi:hypothetical protein
MIWNERSACYAGGVEVGRFVALLPFDVATDARPLIGGEFRAAEEKIECPAQV